MVTDKQYVEKIKTDLGIKLIECENYLGQISIAEAAEAAAEKERITLAKYRKQLESGLSLPVEKPKAVIETGPKIHVTPLGVEVPIITKPILVKPTPKEAIQDKAAEIINRIFDGTITGGLDSLGECKGVTLTETGGYKLNTRDLIMEAPDWKSCGNRQSYVDRFCWHKLKILQVGTKFFEGDGASSTISPILRSLFWDVPITTIQCPTLRKVCRKAMAEGFETFNKKIDFGLTSNNGGIIEALVSILRYYKASRLIDEIAFWSYINHK